jgi:hypothetical protein
MEEAFENTEVFPLNASAQPPGPPAETTTLESRKGGPGGCSVLFGVADL